jgi:glycosyltransferase involved in cell wall biosynthesis
MQHAKVRAPRGVFNGVGDLVFQQPLKIALDATYSLGPNLSGVGVYSRQILNGLAFAHSEARFLHCYRPHRLLASFSDRLPPNSSRRLLWSTWPRQADLFHGLNQRIDARHRRTVSTFHDLFVLSGDYSTPDFRSRFAAQARAAAERSDLIIAVSRFTARQVEQLLKVEPDRIRVIPHGTQPPPPGQQLRNREQMILFVGAIQRRKNVARLVEAFEGVASDWKLVLAGSFGFDAEEALARIERSPRKSDIQVLGYVTDPTLEDLYGRASIFAFPSLDEGFGMPLLDAMSRGVPVLTSNVSAMAEVAGDAALLVDPTDVASVSQGLWNLTNDGALREALIQQGLKRSGEFSWERAVGETWQVYQELLHQR